ncbi:MAG: ComEC/Rec2 family competence protein [Verrucomicrobiota bacterium]
MKAVSLSRQRFPFAGLLGSAILGILFVSFFGPIWWLLVFAAISLPLLILPSLRGRGGYCWVLTMMVFAVLHFWSWNDAPARKLAGVLEEHRSDRGPGDVGEAELQGGECDVRGIVSGEPKSTSFGGASFTLSVEEIRQLTKECSISAPVHVLVRWEGKSPTYGDRVSFQARPERIPPPRNPGSMDYRRWLERHGIYTEFRIDPSLPGEIVSHGVGNPLMAWALCTRHRIEGILSTDLPKDSPELSAIKGITLGVTENAPDGFTDDFRFTGTMHLFAVSGLHVGMLAVIIWFALKLIRIPRLWCVAITIPSLFLYVMVTGMKMGSIRSATMASILLCGFVLFRRSPLLNTLAASAFFQLAWDTNALFSAGWQFSYSVVFAILMIAGPVERWLCRLYSPDPFIPSGLLTRGERMLISAWKHVAGLIGVSASAWVGSLIPTVAYFHLISLSAFGANLLAVPLAFLVLSLGALSLISGCFSLWIAGAFNNANWLVTKLLLLIVQGSALIPGGHWFVGVPHASSPEMTILDLRGDSCAVVRSHGEFALINAGSKRSAASTVLPFLESSGANSLQDILITKADASHLGGLPRIAKEMRLGRIAVSSEPGRSPVAKAVLSGFSEVQPIPAALSWELAKDVTAEILPAPYLVSTGSLVVRLKLGRFHILMLPRLTPEVIPDVQAISPDRICSEVLVMPLGGSEIESTLRVIRRIGPQVIISPVNTLKRVGFPSHEWDRILQQEGIVLLRQDETGALGLQTGSDHLQIVPFMDRVTSIVVSDHK